MTGRPQGKSDGDILGLLGVHKDDEEGDAVKLAEKVCNLRIFEDENGKRT